MIDIAEEAERTLAALTAQADETRAELIEVAGALARARDAINNTRTDALGETHGALVIATERAERAAEIAALNLSALARSSQCDALTGTLNHPSMQDCLDQAVKLAGRSSTCLALLFVDIDRFKAINQQLGHAVGDRVLQIVARRLQSAVRQTDTVSRYGGDEFLVLLSPLSQPADAAIIAAKINAAVAEPIELGGGPTSISASIGIAFYPDDGLDAATLLDAADSAMYRSLQQGPGSFAFNSNRAGGESSDASPGAGGRSDDDASPIPRRDLVDANERLVLAAIASQQASGIAEEARLRQVKFMAMVAHEMRDPLAPLRNAAELLGRTDSDGRLMTKARAIITRQVDHMSRLVEDLIDGSRASAGQFRLRVGPVDIVALIELAIDACRPEISMHGQTLTFAAPKAAPARGDSARLMQIFINLIKNASKYTPQGGAIKVTAVAAKGTIVITVADNGIGISPETLPHVFDLFVQEPGDRARHSGGLGIGLAVVRELAQAHGGTVTAHSDGADRGSEFVVTLPLDRGQPLPGPETNPEH